MKSSRKGGDAGNSHISISVRDRKKLHLLFEELNSLTEKYQLPVEDLLEITTDAAIPCSILSHRLTVLESVVKYLKENRGQTLRSIGRLLGRDERNIWHTYRTASEKMPREFEPGKEEMQIPVGELCDSRLSAQECIVVYLKEKMNMRFHDIAIAMNRNDRTVWTAYHRAKKK